MPSTREISRAELEPATAVSLGTATSSFGKTPI